MLERYKTGDRRYLRMYMIVCLTCRRSFSSIGCWCAFVRTCESLLTMLLRVGNEKFAGNGKIDHAEW